MRNFFHPFREFGVGLSCLIGMALLFVGSLFQLCAQTPAGKAPQTAGTQILTVEGRVEVSRAGTTAWQPAQVNQVLNVGDRVKTLERSRATIRLSNLTVVPLDEISQLLIEAPAQTGKKAVFNFRSGSSYFFNRDKPAELPFKTPLASGATRGTEFHLEVAEDGRTVLTVIEGEVDLENEQGRVLLASGEQGIVEAGKAPTKSTAVIETINVIQWCLYYPGILAVDELALSAEVQQSLASSLAAYRSGDLLKALADYPEKRQPANEAEKVYLAALLLSAGQVKQSEPLLESLKSDGADGVRATKFADALRQLIAAVKQQTRNQTSPPTLATEWMAESYYQQSRSKLSEALMAASEAVRKSPEFGFGWVRVAELEFSFGRTAEALAALEKGTRLTPRNAQAFALKGFLLSAQNKITEAITEFDQAIALDGALANAWLGRGLCKIRQGHAAEGREDLQVAAAREPQRAFLRSYLGKAFSNAGDNPRATKELELARQLDANDPTSWLYSALLNRQKNSINAAVRDLEKSQTLNNNRSVYRSEFLLDQDRAVRSANLAAIYQEAGMSDVSVREAVRAVNSDYANYSAHVFLANSYDALRDPRQVNLRYETPWLSEYLIANLLAPVGGGTLSPQVSQQEYSKLFERDRFGVTSSTEYLSNGDWVQSGSQFGTFGNTSYSFDHNYRFDNGQRPNNDFEQLTLSLKLKQQVTPNDGVYFEAIYYNADGGDTVQYFNQSSANPKLRIKESQEPILIGGYHHEWSPGVHTLFLVSRLDDRFKVTNPSQPVLILGKDATGMVNAELPITINQKYLSDLEIYSTELQQLWHHEEHNLVLGARYQIGDFHTQNRQITPSAFALFFAPIPADQDVTTDFNRLSVYGYHHWQMFKPLLLVAGLSYDRLVFPLNHRHSPITDREETNDRLSPKAGLIWTPFTNTTLRAAYTRSLGGVSFDQSFQLEPSQVAGFNQSFRSLIPESVAGAAASPTFETWNASLEQKFFTGTYLGVSAELLKSEVDRVVGVFDYTGFPPFVPSGTREELRHEEKSLTFTANQLIGEDWSVGARYRLSDARLNDHFVDIPTAVSTGAQTKNEATLHLLDLFAIYQHRCGFFSRFDSIWSAQSNRGYSIDRPGDDFWQFNIFAGYRFPKRKAELQLGVVNLTDQDYQLNPLNLYAELPRERMLTVSLKFNF